MSSIVVTEIPLGQSVRVFKDTDKDNKDFAKYVLKCRKDLIFAIEDIHVPNNLTAKGLIDFANSYLKAHHLDDALITKANLQ